MRQPSTFRVGWATWALTALLALGCGSSDDSGGSHAGGGGSDAGAGTGGGKSGGAGGTGASGSGATGGTSGGSGGTTGGTGGAGGSAGASAGTGGGSAGMGGSAGASPVCGSGEVCVPAVPAGWSGPAALLSANGDTAPACPSAFPSVLDTAHTNVTAAAATCECTATTPSLSSCSAYLNLHTDVSGGVCYGCSYPLHVGSGCSKPYWPGTSCSYVGCIGVQSWYTYLECKGTVSTETLPPPAWGESQTLCGASSGAACGSGSCIPSSSAPICIYKDGTDTCPAAYPNQQTFYRSYSDTRACGCSTTYESNACTGTLQVFADNACATTPKDPSGCATINCPTLNDTAGMSATFTPTSITGTCPTPTAGLSGALTEDQPVTVCCAS